MLHRWTFQRSLRTSAFSALRERRGTQRTLSLPYNNAFARIRLRYLGNFFFLIGSSGRPSHESNNYSILHLVIADPHHAGARRRRSYRIRSTEVTISRES